MVGFQKAEIPQDKGPDGACGQQSHNEEKPSEQRGTRRLGPGRLSGWAQVKVLTINVTGSKESLIWAMTQEVQIHSVARA